MEKHRGNELVSTKENLGPACKSDFGAKRGWVSENRASVLHSANYILGCLLSHHVLVMSR